MQQGNESKKGWSGSVKCGILLQRQTRPCNKSPPSLPIACFLSRLNSMEITVDADFYWISSRLMNVSLNYWRGGEGFYAGFVCTQAPAALAARATSRDHEYDTEPPPLADMKERHIRNKNIAALLPSGMTHQNTLTVVIKPLA